MLEPKVRSRFSSHNTWILLPSLCCFPWSKKDRGNSTPQTLSHNLHELVVPGSSILYLLPIINSSALPPTLFLTKTTLNLILSTAKTKMVFVWSPLRRWFGEKSFIGKVIRGFRGLKGFKKFSGRMEHFLEDELCRVTAVTADEQLVLHAYGLGRTL